MSKTEEYALQRLTASMGRGEQAEMRRSMQQACDTKTMQDIVNDHRTSVFGPGAGPAAKVVPADAGKVTTGTDGVKWGWQEPRPLRPPEGVDALDRIVDHFDRVDKARRVQELAEAARVLKGK
jgi:hypothetical protein